MLCCLGLLLCLPATTASDVHSSFARAQEDGGANAPLLDGTYPLTPAEEVHKTDKDLVNAYFLTMLVLAVASFGASVGWLLMRNAWMLAAMYCWVANDRWWLAAAHEGLSYLGVFRL